MDRCTWQGYGFGAPYEDAACCGGTIGDLDDCDEPGGPIGLRDDVCPQCHGTGLADKAIWVGPMALHRQRALDECLQLCDAVTDKDVADELRANFKGWHALVNRLELPMPTEVRGIPPRAGEA